MPAKGAEYALLQRKYQFENILKTVSSYRERAREREIYIQASERNSLEQQRATIRNRFRQAPSANASILPWTTYEPQSEDGRSKKMYPEFMSKYDMN